MRLAHAYSKIPVYVKQAREILNDVLFIDRSSYYYNEVQIGDIKAFEAGVLLLCNIYKNMGCGIKAIDICKSYVRKHINAFNVFYMLGVLYLDEGDIENSFVSYISAIQLDPTHFCSFLELAKIIRHDLRFRREVIFLLRKAFLSNSRDS